MTDLTSVGLAHARQIVQRWLTERTTSQRTLARAADVPVSSISRFLNGAALEVGSAMRLYSVLRDRLSAADRQTFLRGTGLSSLAASPVVDPFNREKQNEATDKKSMPDWSSARRIIVALLTEHDQSLRQLSAQAELNPSILSRFLAGDTTLDASSCMKLSSVLSGADIQTQQAFLEATGLRLFAKTVSRDLARASTSETTIERHAKQLLAQGDDFVTRYFYADAVDAYRRVANITRSHMGLSVKAATKIAMAYNEAGYYGQAYEVLHGVFQTQEAIDAPEDRARMYRVLGCISFAQKNYREAEDWFNRCITVAQEAGYEPLAETAGHFLGCVYFAMGRNRTSDAQAALFDRADAFFDQALVLHRMYSPDYAAYDLFRKSQMLTYSGDVRGGRKLRKRARQLFGGDLSYLAVDLEEARIALQEGSVDIARRNLNEIIAGWAAVHHLKELAAPLRLLGDAENQAGAPERALPFYVASLCIYPFADTANNTKAWDRIAECCSLVGHQSGRSGLRTTISGIQESLVGQKGHFALLADISQDQELAIGSIMQKLAAYM